ncbi:MAG: chemotaxis protein CheW, partial [Nitrospirota bacterium]
QPCVMAVHHLVEILPARELLPVPPSETQTPMRGATLLGILDYRGKAVPVLRLQLAPPATGAAPAGRGVKAGAARRCFLVIRSAGGGDAKRTLAALEADRVDAVEDMDETLVQPAGDVGLQGHPAVSGMCHVHGVLTFMIDGSSLGSALAIRATTGARS